MKKMIAMVVLAMVVMVGMVGCGGGGGADAPTAANIARVKSLGEVVKVDVITTEENKPFPHTTHMFMVHTTTNSVMVPYVDGSGYTGTIEPGDTCYVLYYIRDHKVVEGDFTFLIKGQRIPSGIYSWGDVDPLDPKY